MNHSEIVSRPYMIAALVAPFALAVPQQWLIPSWYEASVHVAGGLLLVHVIVVGLVVLAIVRRGEWSRTRRIVIVLMMSSVAVGAALVTWSGATREGLFLCGRELDEVVACPGAGEAYSFTRLCVAGNPEVQVEVRSGWLPFMRRVHARSPTDACKALGSWPRE